MNNKAQRSNILNQRFIPKISSPGFAEILDCSTGLLYGFRRYKDGVCFASMSIEIFDTAEQLNHYVDGADVRLSDAAVNILEQIELCWNNWTLLFRGTLWPGENGRRITTFELGQQYPTEQHTNESIFGDELLKEGRTDRS
jgi:hypothetical protein